MVVKKEAVLGVAVVVAMAIMRVEEAVVTGVARVADSSVVGLQVCSSDCSHNPEELQEADMTNMHIHLHKCQNRNGYYRGLRKQDRFVRAKSQQAVK